MYFQRLRRLGVVAFLWCALPGWGWAQSACTSCAVSAPASSSCCQWLHCPPAYRHCQEGPPHIHWHCGCPHPICNPCDLPHWGYWETCWYPWPHPPTPCPFPTPASMVTLNPYANPNTPAADLRVPRTMGTPQGIAPPRAPTTLPPVPTSPIDDLPPPRTLRPGQ